jgi:hypothetical protein
MIQMRTRSVMTSVARLVVARLVIAALLIVAFVLTLPAVGRAADEAPLLPLKVFFENAAASWDHRVSPEGTHLAWVAMRDGRATLHFRRLDETAARRP